jgi:hypothetical protein
MNARPGFRSSRTAIAAAITFGAATSVALLWATASAQATAGAEPPTALSASAPAPSAGTANPHRAAGKVSALDERVRLLAKELILSPRQQDEVRDILRQQQADVTRAWRDESLPAATRVAATRAAQERTAERIRAILNDAQRERFSKPRPADARVGGSPGDLANWMDAMNGR